MTETNPYTWLFQGRGYRASAEYVLKSDMIAAGVASPATREMSVEDVVEQVREANGIAEDFTDHVTAPLALTAISASLTAATLNETIVALRKAQDSLSTLAVLAETNGNNTRIDMPDVPYGIDKLINDLEAEHMAWFAAALAEQDSWT